VRAAKGDTNCYICLYVLIYNESTFIIFNNYNSDKESDELNNFILIMATH